VARSLTAKKKQPGRHPMTQSSAFWTWAKMKESFTVRQAAEELGILSSTIRACLYLWNEQGAAHLLGQEETTKPGRPGNLWRTSRSQRFKKCPPVWG